MLLKQCNSKKNKNPKIGFILLNYFLFWGITWHKYVLCDLRHLKNVRWTITAVCCFLHDLIESPWEGMIWTEGMMGKSAEEDLSVHRRLRQGQQMWCWRQKQTAGFEKLYLHWLNHKKYRHHSQCNEHLRFIHSHVCKGILMQTPSSWWIILQFKWKCVMFCIRDFDTNSKLWFADLKNFIWAPSCGLQTNWINYVSLSLLN